MYAILFFTYILSVVSEWDILISTAIRDNKLINFYHENGSFNTKVRVFELKEGATADIFNSGKTFDFGHTDGKFALTLINTPESLQGDKNKLWLKYSLLGTFDNPTASPLVNWVGYINLDDMTLKNDSNLIQFPTHEKFPLIGYTINTVTNELGTALYVTGGEIYTKNDNSYTVSNSFYKYSFTTKEWVDMTYTIGGKLKPLSLHKSVVINNRYLVILGGERQIYNSTFNLNSRDRQEYEHNSLYNLTIFDTFINTWDNINVNVGIFDSDIALFQFKGFLATAYNDKIIVFGGMAGKNQLKTSFQSEHLGIFDLKSNSWNWIPILNEDGNNYGPLKVHGEIVLFNDQIIISSSVIKGSSYLPIDVYDIPSHRMKSKLRSSNSSNDPDSGYENNGTQNLPIYIIVLVAISCTAIFTAFIYLLYRKNKLDSSYKNEKTKCNGSILEVWSNPSMDSINDIITWDKKNPSNSANFNIMGSNISSSYKSDLIEFNNTI